MISKLFHLIFYSVFLFIFSSFVIYSTTDLHNKILFDFKEKKIEINDLKFFNYFYIKKFYIKNISIENTKLNISDLYLDNLVILNNDKTVTGVDLNLNKKIFNIILNLNKYINIHSVRNLNISNIIIDRNNIGLTITTVKKNIFLINYQNKKIYLNSDNDILNLPNFDLKFKFKIFDNFIKISGFYKNEFLFSGNLDFQKYLVLNNSSFNQNYFKSTNILNDLKLKNDYSEIFNKFIKFNKNYFSFQIPWLKINDYYFEDINIFLNLKTHIFSLNISKIFNDEFVEKNINFTFNFDTDLFFLKLDNNDKKQVNGKFYYFSKNNSIIVNIDKLIFNKFRLSKHKFNLNIDKKYINSSFFDIYYHNKVFNIKLHSEFDKYLKKIYQQPFMLFKKSLKINNLSNFKITIKNNKYFDFIIKSNNLKLNGHKINNKIVFDTVIDNIFIKNKFNLKETKVKCSFDFINFIVSIDKVTSFLKYNEIAFPISLKESSYEIRNNVLIVPYLNNSFSMLYKNNILKVFSIDSYVINNDLIGNVNIENLNLILNLKDKQIKGHIQLGDSSLYIKKKILDFLTKDNIKYKKDKVINNINKSKLKYDILLDNIDNSSLNIFYKDKNINVKIDKLRVLFKNKYLGGKINIKEGNLKYANKDFLLKKSNISILNNKVILSINSLYKDDKIKINIGIFGNANDNNLFLSLYSKPNYPENNLISYLLFDSDLDKEDNTITGDILNIGIDKFKNFLNIPIDSIKILQSDTGDSKYQFQKKINKHIQIQYTKDKKDDDFEIIYKINDNLNINSYTNGKKNGVKLEWDFDY